MLARVEAQWHPELAIENKRRRERILHGLEGIRHAQAMLEIAADEASLATTRFIHAWEEAEAEERYRTAKVYGLI